MIDHQRESWAGRNFSIRVIEFSPEVCPFSNRNHTWKQFHTFRNAVLDILSSYGSVGPSGKMPIIENYDPILHDPEPSTSKPEFFVVDDDMYGLSVRIEASWTMAKPVLLEELAIFLKTCPEWCMYLALIKGGLFIFHDRILYEGPFFSPATAPLKKSTIVVLSGRIPTHLQGERKTLKGDNRILKEAFALSEQSR